MSMRPVDPEEAKWRRRSDARTLAEAEQIKADKERYQGAIQGAKEIANEEIERVRGLAKVANVKLPKSSGNDQEPSKVFSSVGNNIPNCRPRRANPATIGRF